LSKENQTGAADGGLPDRLGELAQSLQGRGDTKARLDEVAAAATRLIPGAQHASISIVTARREVTAEHASSELARAVDEVQTEVEQGPGLETIYEQRTVRVPDMRTESRWPDFARRAHAFGVGSMLSFRLFVQGDDLGALNLFSREIDAFDEESEQVGIVFASHAALALAHARKIENLSLALDNRDVIGQAKGILMERYGLVGEQVFDVLLRLSRSGNRNLSDLARELVVTGRLEGLEQPAWNEKERSRAALRSGPVPRSSVGQG
jgi:transcriptional regulator with GAF, ATPase, and Fis domain